MQRVENQKRTIMAIKIKAVERLLKFDKEKAGEYRYVMSAELYSKLTQSKVVQEAALRSGISKGAIGAAWEAIGDVIKAWATEGHSVAVPGLGTMRFGVRSTSVQDVNDVAAGLITARRVIFTPNVDIKNELEKTGINITCIDRNGEVVKRVNSSDEAEVEDPEGDDPEGNEPGVDDVPNEGGNTDL
jgi:predicted histone-like DNA-binding protein